MIRRGPRWQVYAMLHGRTGTWMHPGSEQAGHFRRTRVGAWWTARRWTRDAALFGGYPRMTWHYRRRRI